LQPRPCGRILKLDLILKGVLMFRTMSGYRAAYHHLTLLVVSEFEEWRVILHDGDVMIQGIRQFSEDKAKEHALAVARQFVHEYKHEDLPMLEAVNWRPTSHDEWLIWKN
jgi:hypothetical protein